MGGGPFLLMLGIYGAVLLWYARNEHRGEDGLFGILGLKRDELYDPEEDEILEPLPQTPREKLRAIVGEKKLEDPAPRRKRQPSPFEQRRGRFHR